MLNVHEQVKEGLEAVLPTYYEMVLHSGIQTPCISYMEISNSDYVTGDTLGYSRIGFQVKIWGQGIAEVQKYIGSVDDCMRTLGFKRTSANELYNADKTKIQKILSYEAIGLEEFGG